MEETYYSVDDVSTMLGIHPKTVRRYITEGKLRAAKLGKQYRISGHDLSVFMEAHGGMAPPQPVQIDVSAVVDITADRNLADRIASSVLAAANAKDPSYGQSTINVQQNGDRMRIMLWGTPKFITAMLECLGVMSDSAEGER